MLFERYHHLIEGKRVGLITNQSGVNSQGVSNDGRAGDPSVVLAALYGPEHGIDGQAKAGAYVESYTHPTLGIPVYSLYGATRMPTRRRCFRTLMPFSSMYRTSGAYVHLHFHPELRDESGSPIRKARYCAG